MYSYRFYCESEYIHTRPDGTTEKLVLEDFLQRPKRLGNLEHQDRLAPWHKYLCKKTVGQAGGKLTGSLSCSHNAGPFKDLFPAKSSLCGGPGY